MCSAVSATQSSRTGTDLVLDRLLVLADVVAVDRVAGVGERLDREAVDRAGLAGPRAGSGLLAHPAGDRDGGLLGAVDQLVVEAVVARVDPRVPIVRALERRRLRPRRIEVLRVVGPVAVVRRRHHRRPAAGAEVADRDVAGIGVRVARLGSVSVRDARGTCRRCRASASARPSPSPVCVPATGWPAAVKESKPGCRPRCTAGRRQAVAVDHGLRRTEVAGPACGSARSRSRSGCRRRRGERLAGARIDRDRAEVVQAHLGADVVLAVGWQDVLEDVDAQRRRSGPDCAGRRRERSGRRPGCSRCRRTAGDGEPAAGDLVALCPDADHVLPLARSPMPCTSDQSD